MSIGLYVFPFVEKHFDEILNDLKNEYDIISYEKIYITDIHKFIHIIYSYDHIYPIYKNTLIKDKINFIIEYIKKKKLDKIAFLFININIKNPSYVVKKKRYFWNKKLNTNIILCHQAKKIKSKIRHNYYDKIQFYIDDNIDFKKKWKNYYGVNKRNILWWSIIHINDVPNECELVWKNIQNLSLNNLNYIEI